jgi:hypothetical protein
MAFMVATIHIKCYESWLFLFHLQERVKETSENARRKLRIWEDHV